MVLFGSDGQKNSILRISNIILILSNLYHKGIFELIIGDFLSDLNLGDTFYHIKQAD